MGVLVRELVANSASSEHMCLLRQLQLLVDILFNFYFCEVVNRAVPHRSLSCAMAKPLHRFST
jgi:hypothetical protein